MRQVGEAIREIMISMSQLESHSKAASRLCAAFVLAGSLLGGPGSSQQPSKAESATGSVAEPTSNTLEVSNTTKRVSLGLDSTEPDTERCERLESELAAKPQEPRLMAELMRALVHLANLGDLSDEERKSTYDRGTEVAEQAMRLVHRGQPFEWKFRDELAEQARLFDWGGALHYWAAMIWGGWGDVHGAWPALRAGVADRLRLHGHLALKLAPDYDWAGPYRFLGRMNAVAPKVPMFTGWVDRKVGQELLELAYERAPEHPQNQLFLAESWLDQEPKNRSEDAEALLQHLLQSPPRPGHETLDRRTLEEARATAEKLEASQGKPRKKRRRGDGQP